MTAFFIFGDQGRANVGRIEPEALPPFPFIPLVLSVRPVQVTRRAKRNRAPVVWLLLHAGRPPARLWIAASNMGGLRRRGLPAR